MKHFLDIAALSKDEVLSLLQRANEFKTTRAPVSRYDKHPVAMLFFEHSTRTRISFELAANKLGLSVIHFDAAHSSQSKGETIEDTLSNLAAMGIDLFVVRHSMNQLPHQLARLHDEIHIVNAGDGQHQHPSQAMLDVMTILAHKQDLTQLKIAIIGDIKHSRVANSLLQLFRLMEVPDVVLVAPNEWQPEQLYYGHVTTSLHDGLRDADVVICLRIQRERLKDASALDIASFREHYAVTANALLWAKQDAIVMHPGPVNRGVEIDSDVVDGEQSCILQQVENGVFMRMAIFDALLAKSIG